MTIRARIIFDDNGRSVSSHWPINDEEDTENVYDVDPSPIGVWQINGETITPLDRTDLMTYSDNRIQSYGSIGDQLDMLYWDAVNGTATWKDHIAEVKSTYPKP
jgi:hypothetical protein